MAKYKVEITEILQYQEIIEAENEQEALIKLKEKYRNEELVLNEKNYITTEFKVIEKVRKRDDYAR
ncbi:DpnD/PcfM family protein [Massilimicrobiota sp. An134]|mgnify:CR=1 FL=1|uniref:DpnD/PcfM family protein n=1 Tax=Massilimicrobiota sp. An134 TaxID=1965557 RepID=UPI000B389436|nr:DpnD/PcfM family protein [Massilimicrobiota sp. An134]OUQ29768.1 hypothetical protein B5E79_05945 [Massilimicrobiota sp. An134]